ncbi:YfiR family protein [Candidatus Omnitrophota bacterium]
MKKIIFLFFTIFILSFSIAGSASEPLTEHEIKAGFLYKFLFFTEWSKDKVEEEDLITICIVGKDRFGDVFKSVEGHLVNGRKLVIKRFEEGLYHEEFRKCQLLFISSSLQFEVEELMQFLQGYPVVTVSEFEGFAKSGGMINFVMKKNKVGFEINEAAAQREGIKFRSKLLRIAILVGD